jgi:hypothetical protein
MNLKEVTVNDRNFKIGLFMGSKGLKIAFRLAKLVGSFLLQNGNKQDNDNISFALEKLDVDELFNLVKDLFEVVFTDKNECLAKCLDSELTANYDMVIPLASEVINHNGFLSAFTNMPQMNKQA